MDKAEKIKKQKRVVLALGERLDKAPSEGVLVQTIKEWYQDELVFCESWGEFLLFNGHYFQRYTKIRLIREFKRTIREVFSKDNWVGISNSKLSSVYLALQSEVDEIIEDVDLDHHWIAFNDCLYNTETHETRDSSSEIRCWKYLDCNYADLEGSKGEAFSDYISTTFVQEMPTHGEQVYAFDPQLAEVVQETLGAIFSGEKKAKRLFIFWGEGANGKSVLTEVLSRLVPRQYVASSSLEQLSSRFGKADLVGRYLNVCSEEESKWHANSIVKNIVTGEAFTAERKGEDSFSYRNYATLISSTNNIPVFKDMDNGMRRRLMPIPFNRTFKLDEQDPKLIEKLLDEKNYIIKFALDGLKRLQKNNYEFTHSDQVEAILLGMEQDSSSVASFFHDDCEAGKEFEAVTAGSLYPAYVAWVKETGGKMMKKRNFTQNFGKYPPIQKHRTWDSHLHRYTYRIAANSDPNNAPKPIPEKNNYYSQN